MHRNALLQVAALASFSKGHQGGHLQERIVGIGASIQRLHRADSWMHSLGIVPLLHQRCGEVLCKGNYLAAVLLFPYRHAALRACMCEVYIGYLHRDAASLRVLQAQDALLGETLLNWDTGACHRATRGLHPVEAAAAMDPIAAARALWGQPARLWCSTHKVGWQTSSFTTLALFACCLLYITAHVM